MSNIDTLLKKISRTREDLLNHKIYLKLNSEEAIAKFMETHVFAVWDFMSLVKALQKELTCVKTPWTPTKDKISRRLINEIVLGEESDIDQNNNPTSHFELYLDAMNRIGAETNYIGVFINNLVELGDIDQAMEKSSIPSAAKDFMKFTFDVINNKKVHVIASVFTFGREEIIPDMFFEIVKNTEKKEDVSLRKINYYLERHIELDGDEHGPLAHEMISDLCDEDLKWKEVVSTSKKALELRISLWDHINNEITSKTKKQFSRDLILN